MTARTRIAAAACLVASGLLVTGGSASLAFASPQPGAQGDGGATATGDTTGGVSVGTKGPNTDDSAESAAAPTSSGPATSTKPLVKVGNGRTGLKVAATPSTISESPATDSSKASDPQSGGSSQTDGSASGELGGANSRGGTETDGQSSSGDGSESSQAIDPNQTAAVDPNLVDPLQQDPGTDVAAGENGNGIGGTAEESTSRPWSWWAGRDLAVPAKSESNGATGLQLPPLPTPLPGPLQLPEFPPLPEFPWLYQIPIAGEILMDVNGIVQPIYSAVTGLATAAAQPIFAMVILPPVMTLPTVKAPPGASAASANGGDGLLPGGAVPAAPRLSPHVPMPEFAPGGPMTAPSAPAVQNLSMPTSFGAGNEMMPAPTYRMGYVEYLRAAGVGQVAAVAMPGVTGILVLTGAGGLIGYRQARAGRALRVGGPARFMG